MNPVTYAQELSKKQGPGYALAIAEKMTQEMEIAGTLGGSPFADEVEMVEQTFVDKETKQVKTKTVTIIDEKAKAKRMKKNLVFWQNVASYLRKRQPAKAA